MHTFLIQTNRGTVEHDFAFNLVESVKYQNWYSNSQKYNILFTDSPEIDTFNSRDFTPVGSLEFVFMLLRKFFGKPAPAPLNIPIQLQTEDFLKRQCGYCDETTVPLPSFIKSATQYKKFTDMIEKPSDIKRVPKDNYFYSTPTYIDSEWRCHVYKGKLVGLNNYQGDFLWFPNVSLIKEMIAAYTDAPIAYTLDVGINGDGTFVIEVHPFVSCGLYGFNDHKILPQMFIAGFKSLLGVGYDVKNLL